MTLTLYDWAVLIDCPQCHAAAGVECHAPTKTRQWLLDGGHDKNRDEKLHVRRQDAGARLARRARTDTAFR